MKKICLMSMIMMFMIACKKENKNITTEDDITGSYIGTVRLYGVRGPYQDSSGNWITNEKWDDTLNTTFSVSHYRDLENAYTITYLDENDSVVLYKNDITPDPSGSFIDSTEGGSSFGYIYIFFRNDSLITESYQRYGMAGGHGQSQIRAVTP